MSKQMNRIELIKEKANAAKKEKKPKVIKYPSYDHKTKKMVTKERVLKSGKEGSLFKRSGIIMSFILVEFGLLLFLYTQFLLGFIWFLFVTIGISIVFACRVAVSNKNSDSKIAWILFLLIFAPIAFIVYLLAGEISTTPLKSHKIKRISQKTKFTEKAKIPNNLPPRIKQDCIYLQNTSDFIPYFSGKTEYFPTGEAFFEDVLEELSKAEKFIFIEFFILGEGYLAEAIFQILIEKAKAGVDVRIISDGLGSHSTLSFSKVRKIKKCGIKIVAFEPLLPIFSFFINYRDHRKIIVVDGKAGYVGGANIADEYINAKNRFGIWKDAGLKIEGEPVKSLILMFLRMWEYSSKKKPDYEIFLNSVKPDTDTKKEIIIPYGDGPSEKQKLAKDVYTNIIINAKKYLYIMTPYFIVDSSINDLLKAKAQSGIDVRIIIPGIPDKKIVYALTLFNAEKLAQSGVRVYLYSPGFIHSKVMLSDDECAVVGSVNMDFRSFYHQYESAAYIARSETLDSIAGDFNGTFKECCEISAENIKRRNIFNRFLLAVLRLFAPLL